MKMEFREKCKIKKGPKSKGVYSVEMTCLHSFSTSSKYVECHMILNKNIVLMFLAISQSSKSKTE